MVLGATSGDRRAARRALAELLATAAAYNDRGTEWRHDSADAIAEQRAEWAREGTALVAVIGDDDLPRGLAAAVASGEAFTDFTGVWAAAMGWRAPGPGFGRWRVASLRDAVVRGLPVAAIALSAAALTGTLLEQWGAHRRVAAPRPTARVIDLRATSLDTVRLGDVFAEPLTSRGPSPAPHGSGSADEPRVASAPAGVAQLALNSGVRD